MGLQDTGRADLGGSQMARVQYGALCWRRGPDGVEVLLITSRDTGRWIIPKGWPMQGLAPEAAAAQEAWEEAGVEGETSPVCIGRYGYQKSLAPYAQVPCAVAVYGLSVANLADRFPEAGERRREWFGQAIAAGMVAEPDLAQIILRFAPPSVGRPAPIAGDGEDKPSRRS